MFPADGVVLSLVCERGLARVVLERVAHTGYQFLPVHASLHKSEVQARLHREGEVEGLAHCVPRVAGHQR